MDDKDTLSPFHTGITADGLEQEFSPVIRAFGTALMDWWRQRTDMEGVFVEARAQARTVLIQRVLAVADVELTLQVLPDELQVRGSTLCRDVAGEYPLARHLSGLGIRHLTLLPGLNGIEFVRFLELCESEPLGRGMGKLLHEAIPEHLEVDAEEAEPVEFASSFPSSGLDDDEWDEEDDDQEEPAAEDTTEVVEAEEVIEPVEEELPAPPHFESLDLAEDMFARMQAESTANRREAIVEEVFQLLLQVAERNDPRECQLVVEKVSELGNQMVIRAKLGTWVSFLQSLHKAIVSEYSLGATRVCQEILDRLGTTRQILCVLQQYDSDTPPEMSLIATYMSMVPATALATVSRCDYWFQTPKLRRLLLRFLREAGPNHPEGVVELARDEDFGFACLAVDVMPDLPPAVATDVLKEATTHSDEQLRSDAMDQAQCLPVDAQVEALPRVLEDSSSAVRQKAMRCLAECGTLAATAPLLKVLQRPGFSSRPLEERAALYRALAISGRPEALFKVEGALIPPSKGLLERVQARLKGEPLDEFRQRLLEDLVKIDRPQTREILRRAMRAGDPALTRAVKALE